jgi:hypothetical protein
MTKYEVTGGFYASEERPELLALLDTFEEAQTFLEQYQIENPLARFELYQIEARVTE